MKLELFKILAFDHACFHSMECTAFTSVRLHCLHNVIASLQMVDVESFRNLSGFSRSEQEWVTLSHGALGPCPSSHREGRLYLTIPLHDIQWCPYGATYGELKIKLCKLHIKYELIVDIYIYA